MQFGNLFRLARFKPISFDGTIRIYDYEKFDIYKVDGEYKEYRNHGEAADFCVHLNRQDEIQKAKDELDRQAQEAIWAKAREIRDQENPQSG